MLTLTFTELQQAMRDFDIVIRAGLFAEAYRRLAERLQEANHPSPDQRRVAGYLAVQASCFFQLPKIDCIAAAESMVRPSRFEIAQDIVAEMAKEVTGKRRKGGA
jgi:hypothetical protein